MMTVSIGRATDENRSDHQRPGCAHDSNGIRKDAIVSPQCQRFLARLREPEVNDAAEELLHAGITIGG